MKKIRVRVYVAWVLIKFLVRKIESKPRNINNYSANMTNKFVQRV